MSIRLMSRVWEDCTDLKGNELLTLLALADSADDEGKCWPSMRTLAEKIRADRATAYRMVDSLEARGYVHRTARPGHSNVFWVTPKGVADCDRGQGVATCDGSHPCDTQGSQSATGGVAPVRPRTVKEPPEEPSTSSAASGDAPAGPGADVALFDASTQPSTSTHRRSSTDVRRGHRLPDDWQPGPADIAWSRAQGFPDDWARRTTEQFRDYWRAVPGQRGRKLDWPATWRNWLRRESEHLRPTARPSTTDERVAAGLRLARQFAEQESLA